MRADRALVFGAALASGPLAVVAPWETAAVGLAMVALVPVSSAARRWAIAAGLAAAVAVGAARGARRVGEHEAALEAARAALPATARCEAHGVVRTSPAAEHGTLRWTADLDDVVCDGGRHVAAVRAALYGGPPGLARGDEVDVVAQLAPPQRLWNDDTGDPRWSDARRGVVRSGGALDVRIVRLGLSPGALIDRARAHVRARIVATFPEDTAAMARALVLGETDLTESDDAAFRASGLSHLLAVSGMHLVLVVLGAVRAAEALLRRCEALAARADVGRIAAACGVVLAWIYADFAGASGSARRAAWMLTAVLAARAAERRADAVRAFGLSLVAVALVDPLCTFDLSFVLSAAATGGLIGIAPAIERLFAPKRHEHRPTWVARLVVRPAAATLGATIACAPVIARFAPALPLGGVVANLLAVPLGEAAALPLCIVHAALGFWPAAERGAAIVASGALVAVRGLARWFAARSWLAIAVPPPSTWQLAAIAVAYGAPFVAARRHVRACLLACASAFLVGEIVARRDGAPRGVLRVTFLDVGQGDAAIVDLPDGEALLIDGGGLVGTPIDVGARVVAPVLRARRRDRVAVAVLSHPHPDHYGGLPSGLAAIDVRAAWDTGQGDREGVGGAYRAFRDLVARRGGRVLGPAAFCGRRTIGGATLDVLAPCPGPAADRGPNDNSIVLRLALGARSVLFVGDAEHAEEDDLVRNVGAGLRSDVLKVGHHGSRTSSGAAFLAAVAPREAVISAGVRNRFGHPSPEALAALERAGARVWRTDRDGAVRFETDGNTIVMHRARPL